jgi:hypothetical protein
MSLTLFFTWTPVRYDPEQRPWSPAPSRRLRGIFGVTSPVDLWFGIQPISAGVFGVPLGFAVIILVSLFAPAPSRAVQEMVEHVRYPNLRLAAKT